MIMPTPKLIYNGTVKDGKITLPKRLRKEVVASFEGKSIQVTFERKKKVRSDSQNAYYWAVVVPTILDALIDLGYEFQSGNHEHLNQVHEFLKNRFLEPIQGADANAVELTLPPSTKRLGTVEFMDYIDNICRWAGESLHLVIPQPGEQISIF